MVRYLTTRKLIGGAGEPAGVHVAPADGAVAGGKAGHGPDNPLHADLDLVDPDQLPSVRAGDVLADLLRADGFPVTRLTHFSSQKVGSGMAANDRCIKAGQLPQFGGAMTRGLNEAIGNVSRG